MTPIKAIRLFCLEALRSKVDFWETVCAEIGAGSDVEE